MSINTTYHNCLPLSTTISLQSVCYLDWWLIPIQTHDPINPKHEHRKHQVTRHASEMIQSLGAVVLATGELEPVRGLFCITFCLSAGPHLKSAVKTVLSVHMNGHKDWRIFTSEQNQCVSLNKSVDLVYCMFYW